jgi:hypothetical protein
MGNKNLLGIEMTTYNPLLDIQTNLEIANGAIQFQHNVITNLRQQIKALRELSLKNNSQEDVDAVQFSHLNIS